MSDWTPLETANETQMTPVLPPSSGRGATTGNVSFGTRDTMPSPSINAFYVAAILIIIGLSATIGMFFSQGSGEHDTFMMAAGIAHGVNSGPVLNNVNYANSLQFMFYYIFYLIARAWGLDAAGTLLALNYIGAALFVVAPIILLFFLRRHFSSLDSHFCIPALLVTSPAYLFTVPYGHPFHIAFFFSLLSFLVLFESFTFRSSVARLVIVFSAVLLQTFALTIRLDQILLFWFVVISLLIFFQEYAPSKWLSLFVLYILSLSLFTILQALLVPSAPSSPSTLSFWESIVNLIRSTYTLKGLSWSVPYHLTGIGVPLILAAGYCLLVVLGQRDFRSVVAFAISFLPSFVTYLPNPSPPRHFIITIIALAMLVSFQVRVGSLQRLALYTLLILILNLLVPPLFALTPLGRREDSTRRTFTFNVIERHQRNKAQIAAAIPFFTQLVSTLPSGTVLFGNWIHIAEMVMIASSKPDMMLERTSVAGVNRALRLSYEGKHILLVEEYDEKGAKAKVEAIKRLQPTVNFISVLDGGLMNAEDGPIPEELNWWSA